MVIRGREAQSSSLNHRFFMRNTSITSGAQLSAERGTSRASDSLVLAALLAPASMFRVQRQICLQGCVALGPFPFSWNQHTRASHKRVGAYAGGITHI